VRTELPADFGLAMPNKVFIDLFSAAQLHTFSSGRRADIGGSERDSVTRELIIQLCPHT